jgi:hypothetical protein
LEFKVTTEASQGGHRNNNVQEISIETDYSLYPSPVDFYEEHPVLYYKNKDTGEEEKSSVKEVRQWYNRTHLQQATNSLAPTRKGYINNLAEESYNTIQNYDVKLPAHATKPTSYKKAGNSPYPQWFRAEEKEKQGFLEFTAWEQINPSEVTPEIRKRALRCHHIYDIKRDSSAKNRVVVNGSRQHSDTYTDTTSPVIGKPTTTTNLSSSNSIQEVQHDPT